MHLFRTPSPRLLPALFVLLLSACRPAVPPLDHEAEKAAILAVVAGETESYYRQDYAAWRNTYLDTSYFRMSGYWEDFPHKVQWHDGFYSLDTLKKKQFEENRTIWKGSTEERSNEVLRIYPGVAWYTFDQDSYEKDTRRFLGRSKELRILEKHDGQWKIVYLGYHYLPLKTTARDTSQ
jgi:hypothetical protein